MGMIRRTIRVALVALLLTTGAASCGTTWQDIIQIITDATHQPPTPDPGPVTPPAEAPYVVTPGQRVDRNLRVPCALEITITGKQPGSPEREEVTMWAVSPAGGDWHGSNPAAGTASASARDYDAGRSKLKVYSLVGPRGEPFLPVAWSPEVSYTERLEITRTRVTWRVIVGGVEIARAAVDATFGPTATLGYGDPPSRRQGAHGARITGVKWEGAEP